MDKEGKWTGYSGAKRMNEREWDRHSKWTTYIGTVRINTLVIVG